MLGRCFRCPGKNVRDFLADKAAATAIEYALIASLLSIGIMAGVLALTDGTGGMFTYIFDRVSVALAKTNN